MPKRKTAHFNLFAVRHIPSQTYMAALRHGRGYTAQEIFQFTPFQQLARLMPSMQSARQALAAWRKGEWEKKHRHYGPDADVDTWHEPPAESPVDRQAAEMDIVTFRCTEV